MLAGSSCCRNLTAHKKAAEMPQENKSICYCRGMLVRRIGICCASIAVPEARSTLVNALSDRGNRVRGGERA